MRIAVDILHPAHVHVFKNLIRELSARGSEVLVTARDKDRSVELLRAEGFDPVVLSSRRPGAANLALELLVRTRRFVRAARGFRPDALVGIMGPTIAPAGRILRVPSFVFYDTERAPLTNRWVYPLATAVVTPRSYRGRAGRRQVRYDGYHELAYLHPSRFEPDPGRVRAAGLDPGAPYVFFRFVAFEASHDLGRSGLSVPDRVALVNEVAERFPVVISSERPLPAGLERFAYRGRVEDVHHALAFARLTVGESATMASESAVLGTPAVYTAPYDLGYVAEIEERYDLVRYVPSAEPAALRARVAEALADGSLAERAHASRERLLAENVDVTAFMLRFLEERVGA